jgi:enoyl-CoA hydratase
MADESPVVEEPLAELVLVERHDEGVVLLTLNRPPMNALSSALLGAISETADALAADESVRAVVVTGNDKAFAAGADVKEFELTADGARRVNAAFRAACDALVGIPRAVIAAVRGYALGGGCELALACDLRIAADTARLGQPEVLLGIIPGGGGTQRLARLIGPTRAKDLIWSGRQVRADEALAIGLVDEVVAADQVVARALARAAHFARGAVGAIGQAKRAIEGGLDLPLDLALDVEADAFAASFESDEARVGVQSFLEHGPGKAKFV